MSNRQALRTARTGNEAWLAGGGMGDVLEALRKEKHISDMQVAAGQWLLAQMQEIHGSSNGLVSVLGERIQCSNVERLYPPGSGNYDSFLRVQGLMHRLRAHERELINFMITHKERTRGSLADWGRGRSAFDNSRSARAFTTGQISSVLSSIGEQLGLQQARAEG